MRTIRENAEKTLKTEMDSVNDQIKVEFIGKNQENFRLFTLRTYIEHEAGVNLDFFKWLFSDSGINSFGKNLTDERRKEYMTWLHDL
jgi:hypothetical protein